MKLHDLFEEIPEITPEQVHGIVSRLKKDCSYFFSLTNKPLWRGLWRNDARGIIFKSHSPENREPKDTRRDWQEIIDNELKKYGFRALRSNSIFCSGDISVTTGYADLDSDIQLKHGKINRMKNIYAIFPIGEFDFTWNKFHDDLFAEVYDKKELWRKNSPSNELEKEARKEVAADENKDLAACTKKYEKKIQQAKEHESDESLEDKLLDINAEYEREMMRIRDYWDGRVEYLRAHLYQQWFNDYSQSVDYDKLYQNVISGFQKNNMTAAQNSKNEIYIHGSYYAVRADVFIRYLGNQLGMDMGVASEPYGWMPGEPSGSKETWADQAAQSIAHAKAKKQQPKSLLQIPRK